MSGSDFALFGEVFRNHGFEVESFSRRKNYLWALEGLRWALAGTRKAKFEVLIREAWDLKLCMLHQKITRDGLNTFLE